LSHAPRAKSREPRAKSLESREPRAKSQEPRAKNQEPHSQEGAHSQGGEGGARGRYSASGGGVRCQSLGIKFATTSNSQIIYGQNITQDMLPYVKAEFLTKIKRSCRNKTSATGTDQFQVTKKPNSYKGVLDFLIYTYVQKLHTIAKQAFSDWRNLNSLHGRFASEVSKTKHQLDYS
jgi:hypothetical protein